MLTERDRARWIEALRICRAGIFDLDGVLAITRDAHFAAWRAALDRYGSILGRTLKPVTRAEYARTAGGATRIDAAIGLLAARDITLPTGDGADESGTATVWGFANTKAGEFVRRIDSGLVSANPGSIALFHELKSIGYGVAIVTASKDAPALLTAIGLGTSTDILVDAPRIEAAGLQNKPRPDGYLEAATALQTPVSQTIVFEDSVRGVRAARLGDFRMIVAVAPAARATALFESGADIVVEGLDELVGDVSALGAEWASDG